MSYTDFSFMTWCAKQRQQNWRPLPRYSARLAAVKPKIKDTWVRASDAVSRRIPLQMSTMMQSRPLVALSAAAGTDALLLAARYGVPALAVPSLGVHVGIAGAAAVFGVFVVDHRATALACVLGAAAGSILAASCALTSLLLASYIIAISAAAAGAVSHIVQLRTTVASCACDEHPGIRSKTLETDAPTQVDTDVSAPCSPLGDDAHVNSKSDVDCGHSAATLELFQRVQSKLTRLSGPDAALCRAKGAELLKEASGIQSTEEKLASLSYLSDFETFLLAAEPNFSMDTEQQRIFDARLEKEFQPIWGNEAVKNKVRGVFAVMNKSKRKMGLVAILGESGSGKNLLANAVKRACGASFDMHCPSMDIRKLKGFARPYVCSEPSSVTSLLTQNPGARCVLVIDELDLADGIWQKSLLDLLGEENQFVDDYFGLPIDLSRLLVIITMKGNEETMNGFNRDLWNRVEGDVVRTSSLTQNGRQAIADYALKREMRAQDVIIDDSTRARVATEICLHSPEGKPGRWIVKTVGQLMQAQALLEKRQARAPKLDPAFVLRVLKKTWTTRHQFKIVEPQFLMTKKKKIVDVVALFAILGNEQAEGLRWSFDLNEGEVVSVDLPPRKKATVDISGPRRGIYNHPPHIDMSLLRNIPLVANELLSQADIDKSKWPEYSDSKMDLRDNDTTFTALHRTACRRLDADRTLLILPLVLDDTDETMSHLLGRAVHCGYDDAGREQLMRVDLEIDKIKKRLKDL